MWGGSNLGHCPQEEPGVLTPDDGELPPRGLTLNSEYLTTASFLRRLLVTYLPFQSRACLSSPFISIYITVYTTLYWKGMLCAKTCVVLGVGCSCERPLVLKRKGISLPSKYVLQIDEHLRIALRCVNLRCEIIDLV